MRQGSQDLDILGHGENQKKKKGKQTRKDKDKTLYQNL